VQTGAAQMLGSEGDPQGDRGGILQWLALAPVAIGTKKSLVQRLQGSRGVTESQRAKWNRLWRLPPSSAHFPHWHDGSGRHL